MSGIFISYRRDDSRHAAGRLYDFLKDSFPQERIFLDVTDVEFGKDFVKTIEENISDCDVAIVLIGQGWISLKNDQNQRRIEESNDIVRFEIETSLRKGVRVIPVLIDDAAMPAAEYLPSPLKSLATLQAFSLTYGNFRQDVKKLIEHITSRGGWEAYFEKISRSSWTYSSFSIQIHKVGERHRLEYNEGTNIVGFIVIGLTSLASYGNGSEIKLDGKLIKVLAFKGGKHFVKFKINPHSNEFKLEFRGGKAKELKLWVDTRLLLEEI
jgi:hypothetical protein